MQTTELHVGCRSDWKKGHRRRQNNVEQADNLHGEVKKQKKKLEEDLVSD
jgi:hypothetical protein